MTSLLRCLSGSLIRVYFKNNFARVNQYQLKGFSSQSDEPAFNMENPFQREKPQCILCRLKIAPDYKNVKLLSQFQSPYTGRIYSKHITGLCEKQQQLVESEIMKAQNAGYMPIYHKDPQFLRDPKLFDVENPIRPHRF